MAGAEVCCNVTRWINDRINNKNTFQPIQRLVHLGSGFKKKEGVVNVLLNRMTTRNSETVFTPRGVFCFESSKFNLDKVQLNLLVVWAHVVTLLLEVA